MVKAMSDKHTDLVLFLSGMFFGFLLAMAVFNV